MEFIWERAGSNSKSYGTTTLYVDDQVAVTGEMMTQPGKFTLSGDGLIRKTPTRA